MSAVTIRNLSDTTHQALRVRAAANGRSTEAEMRAALDASVQVAPALSLGQALRQLGERYAITTEFDGLRDRTPAIDDAATFD